ncbi:porin [Falsirhodobacter sp. alg1]|uniref:porin n=1 Tax=Falsirhodobacter sp. alg1 TaxID=1472418 RepID=UPI0005EF103E|nr:porin [Falsirhodobacter sp. alg1]
MKKLLLATSILAATTGYAAAEISLTGDARMGVVYDGEDVQFSERARVRFNMSGQTDTGLEFGATFRADQASASAGGSSFGTSTDKDGTTWISGSFGKLEMGDVVSAAEEALGDLTAIGYSGLGDFTDIPYINGDGADTIDQGPGALYSYTMGGFEFHAGMTDGSRQFGLTETVEGEDDTNPIAITYANDRDTAYSLAAAYSGANYKVGIGYLDNGNVENNGLSGYGGSQVIVSGEVDVAGIGLKGYYTEFHEVIVEVGDYDVEVESSFGLSADYTFGATQVIGFARNDELVGDNNLESYGVGAIYDLGGGASLRGGILTSDNIIDKDFQGQTVADIGIRLNF